MLRYNSYLSYEHEVLTLSFYTFNIRLLNDELNCFALMCRFGLLMICFTSWISLFVNIISKRELFKVALS